MHIDPAGRQVTATTEEIAVYNMLLTEAIFELLAERGILNGEEVKERVDRLKREMTVKPPFKQ